MNEEKRYCAIKLIKYRSKAEIYFKNLITNRAPTMILNELVVINKKTILFSRANNSYYPKGKEHGDFIYYHVDEVEVCKDLEDIESAKLLLDITDDEYFSI